MAPRYVCCLCKKEFKRLDHLHRHTQTVHAELIGSITWHHCGFCRTRFKRKDHAQRHERGCIGRFQLPPPRPVGAQPAQPLAPSTPSPQPSPSPLRPVEAQPAHSLAHSTSSPQPSPRPVAIVPPFQGEPAREEGVSPNDVGEAGPSGVGEPAREERVSANDVAEAGPSGVNTYPGRIIEVIEVHASDSE